MKTETLILIITLLFSNLIYSQQDTKLNNENMKVVQQLNKPTKIWINGNWEIQRDGSRLWQKGYWSFSEKTFQQKSKILRNRRPIKGQV